VTETGVSQDGTLAPFYVTQEQFLYPLADHVPFREAALTEPLSCVLTGVNQLRLFPGQKILVIGAGPIGVLYASSLNLHGLSGSILEVSPWRRDKTSAILGNRWNVVSSLDEAVAFFPKKEEVFDLVIDTTGRMPEILIPLLARGGQLLVVGLRDGKASFNPGDVANKSLSIIGSIDSLGTFSSACALITNGAIPAREILSHTFPLTEISDALSLLGCDVKKQVLSQDAQAMKVVIEP